MFFAAGDEVFYVSGAVVFAARRFWRRKFQIGIAEEFVEQRGNGAALLCEGGVFVEALAAVGEVGDEGVDEHVAGAGIEGEYLRRLSVGGNDGDVGDAADVEGDAAERGMAVESVVGEGDEWGAVAAESEVGGTEVGDGGDAGACGDDGAFADLESGSGWSAEVRDWRALVKNG